MSVSTPTTGRPTLFLRNATGLVKAWSGFDAFIYSFMSVSLVSLGFGAFGFVACVAGGHILSAVVFSGVFVSFLGITYALLMPAMPREGGDYTWASRILVGGAARGGWSTGRWC